MALPESRNTTYAPGSPVLSADLNAIQDLLIQLRKHADALPFNRCDVGTSSVPAAGYLELAEVEEIDSQALDYGAGISIGSNGAPGGHHFRILGPGARGVWRVVLSLQVASAGTGNPEQVILNLLKFTGSNNPEAVTPTTIKQWRRTRFSATAAHTIGFGDSFEFRFEIGDEERFTIKNMSGEAINFTSSHISISQMSRLNPAP